MSALRLSDCSLVRQQNLINGRWYDSSDGSRIAVSNPASSEILGYVPDSGIQETRVAISHAQAAGADWSQQTSHDRAKLLRRWFELILENEQDLALILTSEQGKPLREAIGEIRYAASFVEWFAEQAKRIEGQVLSSPLPGKRMLTLRQPIGICAAITPWNFPAAMITRKVAPALAAGCAMIVKPSELTPLTALALGELSLRAGIPPGVLQILTGDARAIAKELTESFQVRKLSFTGSTAVGRQLAQQCAATLKRVSLELGGHAPFIVFEDADLDAAATGAVASKYRNAGQTCICSNRFLIHESVYEPFCERLIAKTKELKIGSGLDPQTDIGPLISAAAVAKVQLHIADALERGAKLLLGGKLHAPGTNYFEPTVLANVGSEMLIAQEETFGPVCPLMRFEDEQQVINLANQSEYGLAAYLYSRDHSRVWRVSEALEYGMVGVNTGAISSEVAPFGGIKQSGYGREGSQLGIDEYLQSKYVCQDIS